MSKRVDLILLSSASDRRQAQGNQAIAYGYQWPLGNIIAVLPTPRAIADCTARLTQQAQTGDYLFWDSKLGNPDPEHMEKLLAGSGDLWHVGLRIGTAGLPQILDFVNPTWMLNRDPDPAIEATSWRLSLRACLIRGEILRQLDSVRPTFRTLHGAALEMGHRYLASGVIMRHVPSLVQLTATTGLPTHTPALPFEDELRFAYYCFGRQWAAWAVARVMLTRHTSPRGVVRAFRKLSAENRLATYRLSQHRLNRVLPSAELKLDPAEVSVLIPTLERYSYLRTLLNQLRQQTVKPREIIVVDQTPIEKRDPELVKEYSDLPLRLITLDVAGQCSSRNFGLQVAYGDYIMFLDDDDEVGPTLIEDHLRSLHMFQAEVSSGVVQEVGAASHTWSQYTHVPRTSLSAVFPTNNTLLHRSVLHQTGLFDLAYDHGERADADLGMRVYLSGALMVLNHEISLLHHHAPRGGLRVHGARVITYASSRKHLRYRQLPRPTEIYLALRYFTPKQVREELWLRTLGTLSVHGSPFRRFMKLAIGLFLMPHTCWHTYRSLRQARRMLDRYPQIPALGHTTCEGELPEHDIPLQ
jgi:glycosyltransferase involved in cell wall biosynthesis